LTIDQTINEAEHCSLSSWEFSWNDRIYKERSIPESACVGSNLSETPTEPNTMTHYYDQREVSG